METHETEAKDVLNLKELPIYAELQEKRGEIAQFFDSEGWRLWLKVAKELKIQLHEHAISNPDREAREEARLTLIAFRKFSQLPFYMQEMATMPSADGASLDSLETTPEA